ncbi:MAG: hypothetical protein Q8K90_08140 [Brevundimonas sp.]|nr:hypothetical protein [Brevundimonas sp.]
MAAAGLALSACASLAPYGAQMGPGGQGYAEQRIESNRYRVTYTGVGAPGPVAEMALLRAAELTTAQGYDWFEVTQSWTDGRPDSAWGLRPGVSIGAGSSSYGGRYGSYRSSGVGVGVGLNISGPSPTSTALEVVMGDGPRPDRPNAYDARGVQDSLRPRY